MVKTRIKWILAFMIAGFPFLIFRFFEIQYILHEKYSDDAVRNLDRYKDVAPRRGAIYDRNGKLLVKTSAGYALTGNIEGLFLQIKEGDETREILNEESINSLVNLLMEHRENKKDKESEEDKENEKIAMIEEISEKALNIYRRVQESIETTLLPHKELAIKSPSKYALKKKDAKKDYYRRKYPIWDNISAQAAQAFFCNKSYFCPYQEDKNKEEKYKNQEEKDKKNFKDIYPGFHLEFTIKRNYLYPDLACHLIGRLGLVENFPEEIRDSLIKNKGYSVRDMIGLSGIERIFEDALRGKRGCKVQSREDKENSLYLEKSIDGENIYLSIDKDLQEFAEKSLDQTVEKYKSKEEKDKGAVGGAAVVLNIYTGEILVMASSPRYEIEKYSENYKDLKDDPYFPLVNRAISFYYPIPPGSVFKVPVAAYVLQNGIIDENRCFVCNKYMYERGRFACTHIHGKIDLVHAISGSCNIFFYHLGEMMGPERLEECAYLFGFGTKSGLGFGSEESPGFIPTPARSASQGEHWGDGKSRMFGIGQLINATPLQVARSMAMIANIGIMPKLCLVKKQNQGSGDDQILVAQKGIAKEAYVANEDWKWPISQKNWLLIKQGMARTTEGPEGTAKELRKKLKGVRIACKTGTSQVKGKADHSWFAGFFPLEEPLYAFAVLIEHGGYGATAAGPVAIDLINKIMQK